MNNDGAEQRKCKNTRTTTQFHKWIIENNYPKELQVLCYNCNLEKEIIYKSGRNKQNKSVSKQRDRYRVVKAEVMNHYGGKCSCCGETNINKLTMDHVNGGGIRHYKEIGVSQLYRWIRKNNFPPNFQVLCMNCNSAKYNYGVCPHNMNGLGDMTPSVEKLYVDFVNRLGIGRNLVTDPRLSVGTNEMSFNLLHASMGLVTEAAEVIDLLKKYLAYDRSFDRQKILSEISDIWFYATMILIDQKSSYKEIIDLNMAKLNARYPGGYSHHAANNRNLEVEDKAMESVVNGTTTQEMVTNVDGESVVKGSEKDDRYGPNKFTSI
jgi:5-methylcytosine-specific restriction endonuclease McrA